MPNDIDNFSPVVKVVKVVDAVNVLVALDVLPVNELATTSFGNVYTLVSTPFTNILPLVVESITFVALFATPFNLTLSLLDINPSVVVVASL